MSISGLDLIQNEISRSGFFVKCILTNSMAVEDDYRGNALAATFVPGRIDIRYHKAYSDDDVRAICMKWMHHPDMQWAQGFSIKYQGRILFG